MPAQYPLEFKKRVIKRFEKGESIQTLSQELNVSQSSIYQWRKQYCSIQAGERTYTPKELDAMSKRLHKLEHELEIIRLSGFLTEIPLKTKLETLERLHHEDIYSVHELCEALGVTRGTFYNHIFRRVDRSGREAEQAQLMLKVQQIFDDHEQRFGAEKIRMILSDSGVHVSTKGLLPRCRNWGCTAFGPMLKSSTKSGVSLRKRTC